MLRLVLVVACLVAAASARVQQEDVRFFLTNSRLSFAEVRTGELDAVDVDPTKNVKILCHGWKDNRDSFWYGDTIDEYVRRGRTNVIAVDWSSHSNGLYGTAVNRLNDTAYFVALLVLDLSENCNVPLSKFHVIGHSLGAHLGGFVGQHIFALRGQRIGRITGLDPAGPSYEGTGSDARLSPNDAIFVDAVHTDAGGVGYKDSLADVDYYPNGGVSRQNGCGLLQIGCSHNRAPVFFLETINSNAFVALRCGNRRDFDNGNCANNQRIVMGENVDQMARGDFYLNTRSSPPFGIG